MTIKEVISLMDIKGIPFLPQMSGIRENGKLPIYATEQGVCYWKDESIWSIGIDEKSKGETYQVKQRIQNLVRGLDYDQREMDKYVAVYEVLLAIDEYRGEEGNIEPDTLKRYVEIINKAILDALDFQQIQKMADLMDIVVNDKLYRQMLFVVHEVDSMKEKQFSGYKVNKKNYSFGNIKYCEELDRVNITIYEDCVEIACMKEARGCYERKLDIRRKYTSEEKIIVALDCWKCAYCN